MLVLGIDPGTANTGYGVVRGGGTGFPSLVECGVIRTRARDPLPARLLEIHEGIVELIARHKPDALSVEDVFYARNVRTTVVLGHARGVILLAAAQAGLVVNEYAPAEIKKAVVGTGGATKEQVQFMLTRLLRLKSLGDIELLPVTQQKGLSLTGGQLADLVLDQKQDLRPRN